jgi:ankyrin repeat protein/predicted acylesterase/phospholipase RssA
MYSIKYVHKSKETIMIQIEEKTTSLNFTLSKEIPEHVSHIVKIFKMVIDEDLDTLEQRCIKTIISSFKTHQLTLISSCSSIHLDKLKDLSHKTLMIHAIKPGHEVLVTYLIKNEIGIHVPDKLGNVPLHYAVRKGAIESIPLLLNHSGFNCVNHAGETPLHVGIKAGRHQAVFCLLERGKNILIPLLEDGIKFTPLALAIKYGQKECADLLLNKDLLFQEVGAIGTLLHVAVQYHQPEMVEYLLYSKKVMECLKEKENSFKELIEKKNSDGMTPLNLAAQLGDIISIQLLFEKGASLETEDLYKCRPIHHAVQARQYETVQLLTMLGAKTKVFDHEGKTPIEMVRHDTTSIGRSICGFLSAALWTKNDFKVDLHQRIAENFVFKGGGAKGAAYGGVVRYLGEKGILPLIKRAAGSSAGAFPVVFLGLGASPIKIEELLMKTNMVDYLDPPCSKDSLLDLLHTKVDGISSSLKAIWHLLKSLRSTKDILLHPLETLKKLRDLTGVCEGEAFRKWAEQQTLEMSGIEYLTFGEMRKAIELQSKPYKHITIFGTRLQSQKEKSCIFKFSSEDPECDNIIISDAWRISMSVPGAFRPHTIHVKENGQRLDRPDLGQFVDGGVLNNKPMETYDYKGYQSREDLGERKSFPVFNKRTVGFDLCSSTDEVIDIHEVKTVFDLLKCLVSTYMEAEENIRRLNPWASSRIIKINIGTVKLLDLDMSDEQKEILIQSGYEATKEYFDKSIFQANQSSTSSTLLKAYKGYISIPPLSSEPSFEGKEELFGQIKNFCLPNVWTPKHNTPLALLTESKIDKRETALAFTHRHVDHFSIIKLIDCETEASLTQGYQELAEILHMSPKKETLVADINRELEIHTFTEKEQAKPWLLIFDRVNPDVVEKMPLPKNGGAILAIYSGQKSIWPKDGVVFEIPSLIDAKHTQKQTLLHRAAQEGREQNAAFLVEQGGDINATDESNRTPLFTAVEMGHFDMVQLLLEKKADMTISSEMKDTVLHLCAFNGNAKMLALLLKHPSSKALIDQGDYEGKTPLHKAVFRGQPRTECVQLLCTHGANILAKNQYGYIPLHWSCMHGHLESTKIFIQKKAPQDLPNGNQESPFDLALRENQDDTIHYLLKTKKRLPKIEKAENQNVEAFYLQQIFEAKKRNLIEEQVLYLIKISYYYNNKKEKDLQASAQVLYEAQDLQQTHLKNPNLERYLSNRLNEINIFNQFADPLLLEFGKKAPSYIYVAPGLNILATCETKECDARNKVVWIQKGMKTFNIGEEVYNSNCPICPQTAEKISNLGFYDCVYSIDGLQLQPVKKQVKEKNLIAGKDQVILFAQDEQFGSWPSLKIKTKPRKK